ncbi:MAG: uL14 family ribosomal protein [Nanoarchaeota archaeon]
MRAIKSRVAKGLCHGSIVATCDNSGAKLTRIVSVKWSKTVRRKKPEAGIGDLIFVSVIKGDKEIRKQVLPAVIVRQKMACRRPDGSRIMFEDNALVILKDEKGNPRGTIFKGPIAKEAVERWPGIGKLAEIVV